MLATPPGHASGADAFDNGPTMTRTSCAPAGLASVGDTPQNVCRLPAGSPAASSKYAEAAMGTVDTLWSTVTVTATSDGSNTKHTSDAVRKLGHSRGAADDGELHEAPTPATKERDSVRAVPPARGAKAKVKRRAVRNGAMVRAMRTPQPHASA